MSPFVPVSRYLQRAGIAILALLVLESTRATILATVGPMPSTEYVMLTVMFFLFLLVSVAALWAFAAAAWNLISAAVRVFRTPRIGEVQA